MYSNNSNSTNSNKNNSSNDHSICDSHAVTPPWPARPAGTAPSSYLIYVYIYIYIISSYL